MILQGTTPTLVITFDSNALTLSDVEELELTFSYSGILLKKSISDVEVDTDENTVSYTFTEAETLALPEESYMLWQIRLLTTTGVIVGTKKAKIFIDDLMSEEAMT